MKMLGYLTRKRILLFLKGTSLFYLPPPSLACVNHLSIVKPSIIHSSYLKTGVNQPIRWFQKWIQPMCRS